MSRGGYNPLLMAIPLIHARDDAAAVSGLVKAKHKFEVSDNVAGQVDYPLSNNLHMLLQMHERNPDIESEV